MSDELLLASDVELKDALSLGQASTYNGLPIHRRWVRTSVMGTWTHPVTGEPVPITPERMARAAKNVKAMLSRGIDIPVSATHKYTDPRNTLGAITDARVTDGELELEAAYYGDDSLAVAAKNKVSLGLAPFTDSRGNKYDETVTHLAVTPVPVLHGLPGFVTLSRESIDLAADREPLTGGHWVTIDGEHVYIKDGKIAAGPANLEGKTIGEAANEGKHVSAVHGANHPTTGTPEGPKPLLPSVEDAVNNMIKAAGGNVQFARDRLSLVRQKFDAGSFKFNSNHPDPAGQLKAAEDLLDAMLKKQKHHLSTEDISTPATAGKGRIMNDATKTRVAEFTGKPAGDDVDAAIAAVLDKAEPLATTNATLSRELGEAKATTLANEPNDDPKYAKLLHRAHTAAVQADIASGAYSKATGDLLLSRIENKPGEANVTLLSREESSPVFSFDDVRAIAKAAKPGLVGGAITGVQGVTLARETPTDNADDDLAAIGQRQADAIRERKLAEAGVK